RCIFQLGAIALGLGDALLERRDLRAGALLTFDPAVSVHGELRQPTVGKFGLAHDRLLFGLNFGERSTLAGNIVAHLRKLRFKIGGRSKGTERGLSLSFCRRSLVTAHGQSRPRFRERRKPRSLPVEIALTRPRLRFSTACCIEGRLSCPQRMTLGIDV